MGKAVGQRGPPRLGVHVGAPGHTDPDRLQQHQGLVVGEPPLVDVFAVIGIEVLVDAAVADDAADRLFETRYGLNEPLRLHRLAEGPGRMLGNPLADVRDLVQLAATLFPGLGGGHRPCQLGVAMGKCDHRIADQANRLEERLLLDVSFGVERIERLEPFHGFTADRANPALEHFPIVVSPRQHRTARRGRRDDEDPLHEAPRLLGKRVHRGRVVGVSLPVRKDIPFEGRDVFLGDDDRVTRLTGHQLVGMGVEAPGADELAVDHRVAAGRPSAPDEQFLILDVDRVMRQDVSQRLAPTEHHRLPLGLFHRLGQKASPIDVQPDRLVAEALEHPLDAGSLGLRSITDQADRVAPLDARLVWRQHLGRRRGGRRFDYFEHGLDSFRCTFRSLTKPYESGPSGRNGPG